MQPRLDRGNKADPPAQELGQQVLSTWNSRCSQKTPADEGPVYLAGIRAAVGLKALCSHENRVRCPAPS